MIQIFTCDSHDLSAGLWPDMAREERERNLELDLAREATLARLEALGEAKCPWPWYAEAAIEVCEPEVFGP